jgi:hypothetical protein
LTARFENLATHNETQRGVNATKGQTLSQENGRTTVQNALGFPSVGKSKKQRSPLFDFDKPLPQIVATSGAPLLEREGDESSFSPPADSAQPLLVYDTPTNEDATAYTAADDTPAKVQAHTQVQVAADSSLIEQLSTDVVQDAQGCAAESKGLAPKAVAFAPSPKKPIRVSHPSDPMPEYALDQVSQHLGASSSSGNFAKPTLASVARARTGGVRTSQQMESSMSSPGVNSVTMPSAPRLSQPKHNTDVFGSSISRNRIGSALMRRNSSGGSNRRTEARSSYDRSKSFASSSANIAAAPTQQTHSNVTNSIPFISQSTMGGLLRSASPQSFTATSGPDYLGDSRRSSWQGRHHSGASVNAMSAASSVRSIGAPSWSEMTQDDLVNNLGARERTRQEVLWEIVASEERYVQELEKTKGLYIDALLHPRMLSEPKSPRSDALASLEGAKKAQSQPKVMRQLTNVKQDALLPIASRFASNTSKSPTQPSDLPRSHDDQKHQQPRIEILRDENPSKAMLIPSASGDAGNGSALKRWSKRDSRRLASTTEFASSQLGYDLKEEHGVSVTLPPALLNVLEAIDKGILEGHSLLHDALRQRYDDQWPLVRSLADVFARFSSIFDHYREYVLNLERALDCLEEAALMERAMRGKRLRKDRLSASVVLGRAIATLDSAAAEQGECGLAIFLALPFQRLLKYPLLFQNLLFHTDASTFEFENTVQMVVDVERLVRSIEDEKCSKEERDKTIDAFARIEGVKDRALLRPKTDRILIEELPMYEENPRRAVSESNDPSLTMGKASHNDSEEIVGNTAMSTPLGVGSGNVRASVRNKRSYRRLSDLLTVSTSGAVGNSNKLTKAPNMGSKRDVWIVRFSDVELRCQRVGVTALPLISTAAISANVDRPAAEQTLEAQTDEEMRMREEFKRSKESKERMRALRNTTLRSKTRNLYRFIGVAKWKATRERRQPTDDLDYHDGLATAMEEDEEIDDAESENERDDASATSQETDGGMLDPERYIRQSKLSFSYGVHDQVEPRLRTFGSPAGANGRPGSSRSLQHTAMLKRHSSGAAGSGLGTNTISSTSLANQGMPLSRAVIVASRSRQDKFGARLRQDESHQRRGSLPLVTSSTTAPFDSSDRSSFIAERDRQTIHLLPNESLVDVDEKPTSEPTHSIPTRPSFFGDDNQDSNLHLLGTMVETGVAR